MYDGFNIAEWWDKIKFTESESNICMYIYIVYSLQRNSV